MNDNVLHDAINLAGKQEYFFIATADNAGTPHMAAASRVRAVSDDQVGIDAWFCPGTLENLEQNKNIALVIWDQPTDHGYQLLGFVESLEDIAMMNGYAPEQQRAGALPQVEIRLLMRVTNVMAFSNAPHSDTEPQ